ncbi:MFS transporter [Paraburkholderia sp. SARCC-3016]|uniref:MFS transporter n=1 Tax=Paraburkholderia sp. SARCC-3016 TaxID=3058611 RepID=UPI00280836CD|nr:MFS transporter [Paraburkholderia sp. SARCC-3016]MDQ7982295.1 MFS transporter [Paraburkholderia sp. SARCC-3016]
MQQQARVSMQLIPFTAVAFLGFLAIGLPLPTFSIYAPGALHVGTGAVGTIVGLQSVATLLTRQCAGRLADARGPKATALLGLLIASATGWIYVVSNAAVEHTLISIMLLCAGRLLLGLAESMFITALAAWSIARVGSRYAGQAMAWSGIAMYAALAAGAPIGLAIYRAAGFPAVAVCSALTPLAGAAIALCWQAPPVQQARDRESFIRMLRVIWVPGLGMALASSGAATLGAFMSLRYSNEAWPNAGFALSAFGGAYIAVRVLFGGLPDRLGGYRIGTCSLFLEAVGLTVISLAARPAVALLGACITGLGYSLVFPSLGVEAMRRVPGEGRGLAIGAYLACFDLGLAVGGPGAGVMAAYRGVPAAFTAAAGATIVSLALLCADWWNRNGSRRAAHGKATEPGSTP